MQLQRSDLIGGGCAALALALIAWLSLDSWAITRCDAFIAAGGQGPGGALTAEQAKCVARQKQPAGSEN